MRAAGDGAVQPASPQTGSFTLQHRFAPDHTYHNLLKSMTVTQAHQVWCSDLSRLVYRGTIWYLATIEDSATQHVIVARIGKRHDSHLVLATLKQALATGYTPTMFQSDQGTEFMAQRRTDYLEQRGSGISISATASPWQNGFIESFFGRFKQEFGNINRFDTAGEMLAAV